MNIKIYNTNAETVKEVALNDKVFGVKLNNELVHQAMVAQMGNERQVLAHTLTKAEVRGGGKKPWKQKGTGRARAGSSRSPIWIGGGIIFGPRKERNFSKKINKKMRQKALYMVLSDKVANDNLVVLDKLEATEYKTKAIDKILKAIETKVLNTKRRNLLLVNADKSDKLEYSARNLAGVEVINLENLNLLDVLKYKNLLLTESALEIVNAREK